MPSSPLSTQPERRALPQTLHQLDTLPLSRHRALPLPRSRAIPLPRSEALPLPRSRAMALALALSSSLFLGCGGAAGPDPLPPEVPAVTLNLQGQFEKLTLGPSGLATTPTLQPTRCCYGEVVADDTGEVLATGYLGADGGASVDLPQGVPVRLVLYSRYQVPGPTTAPFLRGSVKLGAPAARYATAATFNALPGLSATGPATFAQDGATLTALARVASPQREAGAFNITDQAAAFGLAIQALEPGLTLPDLHMFWQPGNADSGFPAVVTTPDGTLLLQDDQRAIFQMAVRGSAPPAADAGADEFNDGLLQQRFSAMLFAPYSYPGDGSSPSAVLRGDNDTAGRSQRGYQGESTAAFITGFCDFLSTAVRAEPSLTTLDPSGQPSSFHLDRHGQFSHLPSQGEFYSDAISVSLYGIWQSALGGGKAGLQTLWQATLATTGDALLNCPLGCYPSYLAGLASVAASSWPAIQGQLLLEDIGDVISPAYFAGPTLWLPQSLPFSVTGALHTYAPTSGIHYDRDQAQAYRFHHPGGPCDLTLRLDSQDAFLELIGPNGRVAGDTSPLAGRNRRTLALASLPAGDYAARVRVGFTTADDPRAGYQLDVSQVASASADQAHHLQSVPLGQGAGLVIGLAHHRPVPFHGAAEARKFQPAGQVADRAQGRRGLFLAVDDQPHPVLP